MNMSFKSKAGTRLSSPSGATAFSRASAPVTLRLLEWLHRDLAEAGEHGSVQLSIVHFHIILHGHSSNSEEYSLEVGAVVSFWKGNNMRMGKATEQRRGFQRFPLQGSHGDEGATYW